MIRRSRFVVADFTGQRGGVYFEAGYALGLGLRVIWLCRDGELKDVHFDTRQYNFLVWKAGEYADLAKRLQNRIEATLGRGPIKPGCSRPTLTSTSIAKSARYGVSSAADFGTARARAPFAESLRQGIFGQ